jgi:hypothetical protein
MCKNGKCSLFLPENVTFWELCNGSTSGNELHHLHYLHVNFKILVMKEEKHPKNIDIME